MDPAPQEPTYTPMYATDEMRRAQPGRAPAAAGENAAADAELMRAIAAGDDQALGALYDRWSAAVRGLVQHIVRDAGDADDIVEDTFWQVWRTAARYDLARGSVSTWILTIARSRALDRLRAIRRLREESLVPENESPVMAASADALVASGPVEHAEAAERRTLVTSALSRLPSEQREALELAYFAGFSQSEIAERTGQPLGTVKTRMRLGMKKLRDQLQVLWEGVP